MADTPKAPASASDEVREALKRFARAEERERENSKAAYEDLAFRAGDQWPQDEKNRLESEGRPALTMSRIPAFVRQVTNDIRMMRPAIKTVPVDDKGDPETAEIFTGMIRYVENRSDAQAAYFIGMDSQVVAGIGHWKVVTEYASEKTFDQEIRIAQIDDGVGVMWDPDSTLPTREDAMWCFEPVDMTHDAFKERYPDAQFSDLQAEAPESWYGEDFVRIARYWCKKPVKRTLALMPDGSVVELGEDPEKDAAVEAAQQAGAKVRVETRDGFQVTHCVMSAAEVLEEEQDWPGRFIPIVPVLGEEVRIGRKVVRHGAIRYAKDAQRMFNYAQSAQVEAIALQPKAPWLVTEDNVKAYAAIWAEANSKPLPYLPYKPDPTNGGQPPTRAQPAIASTGLAEMIGMAGQNMKDIIGIQDAGLGERSNETSGKAIVARQREGDVGMFTYVDNFSRAVRHTGTILIDLIPKIYDTQRMIRVMGEDGAVDLVPINQQGTDPNTGLPAVQNDLTVGSYDVVVQSGPGYSTRREEARDGMIAFMQAVPAVAPIILDLYAKAQDWPMAEEFAERARAMMPPAVLQMLAAKEAEKTGQPPPQQEPGPGDIKAIADAKTAEANSVKAGHDAEAAKSKAEQEQIKAGQMLADSFGLASQVTPPPMADPQTGPTGPTGPTGAPAAPASPPAEPLKAA